MSLLSLSGFHGALFYLVGTFFDKQLHLNTSWSRSILASLKGLSRKSINDDDHNDDDDDDDDNDNDDDDDVDDNDDEDEDDDEDNDHVHLWWCPLNTASFYLKLRKNVFKEQKNSSVQLNWIRLNLFIACVANASDRIKKKNRPRSNLRT